MDQISLSTFESRVEQAEIEFELTEKKRISEYNRYASYKRKRARSMTDGRALEVALMDERINLQSTAKKDAAVAKKRAKKMVVTAQKSLRAWQELHPDEYFRMSQTDWDIEFLSHRFGQPIEEVNEEVKEEIKEKNDYGASSSTRRFANITQEGRNCLLRAARHGVALMFGAPKNFKVPVTLDDMCLSIANGTHKNTDFIVRCDKFGQIAYLRDMDPIPINYYENEVLPIFPLGEQLVYTDYIRATRDALPSGVANMINVIGEILLTDKKENSHYRCVTVTKCRTSICVFVPPNIVRNAQVDSKFEAESNHRSILARNSTDCTFLDAPGNSAFNIIVVGENIAKPISAKIATNWRWYSRRKKYAAFGALRANGGCTICCLPDKRTVVIYNNNMVQGHLSIDGTNVTVQSDHEILDAGADVLRHLIHSHKVTELTNIDFAATIKSKASLIGTLGELITMQVFGAVSEIMTSISKSDAVANGRGIQVKTMDASVDSKGGFLLVTAKKEPYHLFVDAFVPIVQIGSTLRIFLPLDKPRMMGIRSQSITLKVLYDTLHNYVDIDILAFKSLMEEDGSYLHVTDFINGVRGQFTLGELSRLFGDEYSPFDGSTTHGEKQALYKCLCDIVKHMF
jgi:hypothetical protein